MKLRHTQMSQTNEVLMDLAKINADRIDGYQAVQEQFTALKREHRDAFYVIISDGLNYTQQLYNKTKQMGDTGGNAKTAGKIYRAWTELKGAMTLSSQRAIIASCIYNEEVALHAYSAALGTETIRKNEEIYQLIVEHEKGIKENYDLLKSFKDTLPTGHAPQMYLAF